MMSCDPQLSSIKVVYNMEQCVFSIRVGMKRCSNQNRKRNTGLVIFIRKHAVRNSDFYDS